MTTANTNSQHVAERLASGANWARSSNRHNLGSLLEALLEELRQLRLTAEQSHECSCSFDDCGWSGDELAAEVNDLGNTMDRLEKRLADVEVDLKHLEQGAREIRGRLDDLEDD